MGFPQPFIQVTQKITVRSFLRPFYLESRAQTEISPTGLSLLAGPTFLRVDTWWRANREENTCRLNLDIFICFGHIWFGHICFGTHIKRHMAQEWIKTQSRNLCWPSLSRNNLWVKGRWQCQLGIQFCHRRHPLYSPNDEIPVYN